MTFNEIFNNVVVYIVNPTIGLFFLIAFVVFIYGIVRFMATMGEDAERETGKRAIGGGLIGMLVMVTVFGIIHFILNALDVNPENLPF